MVDTFELMQSKHTLTVAKHVSNGVVNINLRMQFAKQCERRDELIARANDARHCSPQHNWTPVGGGTEPTRNKARKGADLSGGGGRETEGQRDTRGAPRGPFGHERRTGT